MIKGFDLSYYQWSLKDDITGGRYYVAIDYARAKAAGIEFAFLKACDGVTDTPLYNDAMRQARESGMRAAPYVWLYQGNAKAQADFWITRLKDEPLIVIDFEHYGVSYPTAADLKAAILRLREIGFSGKIMIYTGHWYWKDWGSTDPFFAQFPVWLARYSVNEPQITPPWTTWDFWQYTGSADPVPYGIANGVAALDLDYFTGTIDQLKELFGKSPEPPIGGTTMQGKVLVDVLNIRNAPSTGAVVGALHKGEFIEASEKINGWWHLTKIGSVATPNNWYAYEGATQGFIQTIVTPPAGEFATVTVEHNGKTGTATIELK